MKQIFIIVSACLCMALVGCSKDSDSTKVKIEHKLEVKFVDAEGDNIFNNQTYDNDAIRIVWYDSDGEQHDFYNPDWFAMYGYTVDRFYGRYVFQIYLTLPEDGTNVTETYMLFFNEGPDVFTTEYEVKQGKNPEELYGGGTVRLKRVKFNGKLIWDRDNQPEGPVEIVKQLPVE